MSNSTHNMINQPRTLLAAHAITLTIFIALFFSAGATYAQDASGAGNAGANKTRASYAACVTKAAGVTPDMKQCMGTEYAYQDKRLNRAYKALMATLGKDQQATLRDEERTWITYRDSHCALDPNGGQAAELDAYDCSVEETAKQASALEDRLHIAH
ncbi:lysozyme inhibitor LprI family protein [Rhodanobacter sp. L36]|uniref:lysozyme inhibitor LprI family protein n=1 Tax=Rhodanobacter sp. L36 TaxID=1747221 RepID=UPI0020B14EFC|nr:lysozyme inhibitor LprI family protein [Rhodanobacter sp. L36]